MSGNKGRLCRDLIGGSLQIKNQFVLDKDVNLTVNDAKVKGDLTLKGKLLKTKQGIITVGPDKPLKDVVDSFQGMHVGCLKVVVPKGVHNGCLSFRKFSSVAEDDANVCADTGLLIQGDTRTLTNMTYIDGGRVDVDAPNLGHYRQPQNSNQNLGFITLNDGANTITVVVDGGDPDFGATEYGAGDTIKIRDDAGDWHERLIVSLVSNVITYDGADVTVGDCSAVIFCPCVVITPDKDDCHLVNIAGCGVTFQGIWFKNTNATTKSLVHVRNGRVGLRDCLLDAETPVALAILSAKDGGMINCTRSDTHFFQQTHASVTVIALENHNFANYGVFVYAGSHLKGGIFRVFRGSRGMLVLDNSSMSVLSVQAIEQEQSMRAQVNCSIFILGWMHLRKFTQIGLRLADAGVYRGGDNFQSNATIIESDNHCGVDVDRGSTFIKLQEPWIIGNCDVGILGADCTIRLESDNFTSFFPNLEFSGNGTDFATQYSTTVHIRNTDSRVLKVGSSQTLNNPYLLQSITADEAINISFDPDGSAGFGFNEKIYLAKTFCVNNLTTGNAHTISLNDPFGGTASFIGPGLSGENQAEFAGSTVGEFLQFTILTNELVQVKGSAGVTFNSV